MASTNPLAAVIAERDTAAAALRELVEADRADREAADEAVAQLATAGIDRQRRLRKAKAEADERRVGRRAELEAARQRNSRAIYAVASSVQKAHEADVSGYSEQLIALLARASGVLDSLAEARFQRAAAAGLATVAPSLTETTARRHIAEVYRSIGLDAPVPRWEARQRTELAEVAGEAKRRSAARYAASEAARIMRTTGKTVEEYEETLARQSAVTRQRAAEGGWERDQDEAQRRRNRERQAERERRAREIEAAAR